MNGDHQSRKEANTKIQPLAHPRKQIKVACWNADGKTEQIIVHALCDTWRPRDP